VPTLHITRRLLAITAALLLCLPPLLADVTPAAASTAVQRLAGPARTATAVAVAQHTDPARARTVVIARADDYADALTGGPLAARLAAPVLLTSSSGLDPVTAAEVRRLRAEHAILLGGSAALSELVEVGLRAAGVTEIDRLAGATRFDTAAAVAGRMLADVPHRRIYLAEGANADPGRGWPDALAASALAAAEGGAILLTSGSSLPEPTVQALQQLEPSAAIVVGGRAAVPEHIEAALRDLLPAVERLAGATRYETAALLADRTAALPGHESRHAWLASGGNWPDALVAGPAAARTGGVLLLTDPHDLGNATATRAWLERAPVAGITVVGGAATVSEHVAAQAAGAGPQQTPAPVPAPVPAPAVEIIDAEPWSDPGTWGGATPGPGAEVVVPAGRTIVLDVEPPALRSIEVLGTLVLADVPMTIRTGSIMVHGAQARFVAGEAGRPLRSRIEIVLDGDVSADVHGMGSRVLGAMAGGTIDLHGTSPSVSWTRLAETAAQGTSTILLERAVDWTAGDEIVIASTSLDPSEAEQRTVVAADGHRVHLDEPLTHLHWGGTHRIGETDLPMHAEVGLLTRNLVIRGPEHQPGGIGGHTMAMTGAQFRASGTEFARLGQRGITGRYPVHFHLLGDAAGSYLRSSSIHSTNQRCVTLHGSSNVELTDNVAYDAPGHCFFFEDGAETGNRLTGNLGLSTRVPEPGTALLDSDATPATFWVQHPSNHLVGNVAAGSAAFGFWYDLPRHPTGLSATETVRPREAPLGTFDRNVAHSNAHAGEFRTGTGLFIEHYRPPETAAFTNFISYKNSGFGIWSEHTPRVTITGAILAGNGIGFTGPGTTLRDSTVIGHTPNDGTRPWVMLGVGFYTGGAVVDGVTFANFRHEGHRQHAAMGSITHEHSSASRVTRARFANVTDQARVRVTPQWADGDASRTAVFLDEDGSVSGAPAAITADHPVMAGPSCTARSEWRARVCPIGQGYGMVLLADMDRGAPIGPVTVSREGYGSGPVLSDPGWASRPQALFTAQFGGVYSAAFGRTTPSRLEVVLASAETAGEVNLQLPWPHATVHVYRGWGEWATPLHTAPQPNLDTFGLGSGVVTLRPHTDATNEWSRWVVCAERGCGEGIGSRRE
jgi:putative cell wall-binding protein